MEPEDLKSYKIRVQDSDAYIQMIDMMGGIGIPMAQSEVYAAVQQHVIEGGENSEVVYNNFKHYEVSPYFCYTNHLVMTDVVVANKDFLEEMDPETREIFNTLIKESMEVEFAEWDKGIEAARQELASQGVTFVESWWCFWSSCWPWAFPSVFRWACPAPSPCCVCSPPMFLRHQRPAALCRDQLLLADRHSLLHPGRLPARHPVGLVVMVLAGITAKKRGYVAEGRMPARVVLRTVLDAIPSLLLIVIIIGGILGGVFTATEASAVAVAYATVLAFLYKGITLKDLPRIILDSARMTGIIALMIGLSSIMSWVMAFTGLPDLIAGGILSLTRNKYVILVLMNVILLVVGTFMDPTPAVLIFTPIFLPICQTFGMHPVQFGIMVSMNLCIGTITPPVGSILFTGCKVGRVDIESVVKELLPYFAAILVTLLLVTYIPAISMALPTAAGLIK